MRDDLTAEEVRSALDYNPSTGVLAWRTDRKYCGGKVAGTVNSFGYIVISFNDLLYKAHRVAWLHYYGEWPHGEIDHANLDKSDNRIVNLRTATHSLNAANSNGHNASGLKGVDLRPNGTFRARLRVNGKIRTLGHFSTSEAAGVAYSTAAKAVFGEFARVSQ